MIILDTDHISVLRYDEHPRCVQLKQSLQNAASGDVFATTIVSAEEKMRGWLARIHSERNFHQQISMYVRLSQLFKLFGAWRVELFDSAAVDELLRLRGLRIRIGTQDLKIAAIVLSRNALLLSANLRDFEKVPGLRVENWLI